MKESVVVIPTIREKNILEWLRRWETELINSRIILIEDNPHKTFEISHSQLTIEHYSWEEIDAELGEKSWIIPRRTDCVRSFGLYKAWQQSPDMIVTMDDDCYPDDPNYLSEHASALFDRTYSLSWFQHAQTVRVRGVPFSLQQTEAVANMGLWSNVPDLDATTQLENPKLRLEKSSFSFFVPFGYYAPISGMNVAFKRDVIPAAYFLLMGRGYEFDRFGDIWMGIFLKKICDHLQVYITGGNPYVRHERASNPEVNLRKEKPGYEINDSLWQDIDNLSLSGNTFIDSYSSLADQLPTYSDYWEKLREAMKAWITLFQ